MAEKSDLIRGDIAETRQQMGDTLDALGYKANVPARTKGWFGRKRDAVTGACGSGISKVSGAADSVVTRLSGTTPTTGHIQASTGRMKDTVERNPLGLAIAAAGVGFVTGLLAPSTRVENEKLGPVSDEVKSQALDAGHEALEHGKQVAQAAAQSAVETAKQEGRQHGQELAGSVQDRAQNAGPTTR